MLTGSRGLVVISARCFFAASWARHVLITLSKVRSFSWSRCSIESLSKRPSMIWSCMSF